jgi:hypothetical protein
VEVVLAGTQIAAQGARLRAPCVGAPVLGVLAPKGLLAALGATLEITGLAAQVVSRAAVAGAFMLWQQAAELAAIEGFVLPVLAIFAAGVGDLLAHVCAYVASLLGALMHRQSLPCKDMKLLQLLTLTSVSYCNVLFCRNVFLNSPISLFIYPNREGGGEGGSWALLRSGVTIDVSRSDIWKVKL